MKQKLLLKTMLLLFALIAGSSSVWAAENDTHDFSQTLEQLLNNKASIASINIDAQSYSVKEVIITYRTTQATSKVDMAVTVGSTDFGSFSSEGKMPAGTTHSFSGTATTGAIQIVFTNKSGDGTGKGTFYVTNVRLVEGPAAAVAGTTVAPSIYGSQIFAGSTTVTITNDASATGAAIYYTLNGDDPTTTISETCFLYDEPFSINETTTVKAIAKHADDDNASVVTSKTFTKVTAYDNIAALVTGAANGYVQLTNALVTYKNGSNAYLEDESGAILLQGCAGDLAVGDKITGLMNVTNYTTYYSLPEIKEFSLVEGYTKSTGNTVTPTEVTLEELLSDFNSYLSRYVIIRGATVTSAFSSKNCIIQQGDKSITLRDQNSSATLTSDKNDLVNVIANVIIYNTTKQIAVYEQSQIVVKTLTDNAISGVNDSYELDLVADGGTSLLDLSTATATSGGTVKFTIVSATQEDSNYDFTAGVLSVSEKGEIVIKAFVNADDTYKYAEKTTTITVLGEKDDPNFDIANQELAVGETFTLVADTHFHTDGEVTLSTSNASVASVAGLVVTANAVGTATITVNAAEGIDYKAGSETFTVTVTSPTGKTIMPVEIVFKETFDTNDGTGGNDGSWNGSIASNDFKSDNTWETQNATGADRCAKFGTGSKKGVATTPALGEAGTFTLSFKAAAWNGNTEVTDGALELTLNAGSFDENDDKITSVSFNLKKGEWDNYEATIYNATASTTITFSAKNASNNRFFLDEVLITKPATNPSVTLSATGYASYCNEYPLDFTTTTSYKAYYVSDVTETTVTFSQITGKIKGGQGIILYGTPNISCELTYCESDNELSGNMLVGTLAPTAITTVSGDYTNFALSGGKFKKINNGTLPANKAYLPILTANLPSSAPEFSIVFEDGNTTGVNDVRRNTEEGRGEFYNLNGQRVANPTKGLYIVNGKKIVIK